ncbi:MULTISPECIES: exodeoxyribonuclease VII small subunit [Hyphomonas]|jgi:exodeoxyribonuclease VII small subunit|uniref:Exodeoxyribonuclease 7 small subunit n=1 Tax=Hyphomonas atlantica TaxID=1280948 RepID=A0A059DZZ5_9PROT|nr:MULTISPECIES: exodeoxyribonuclease VII small subunit [Hyphomonas]OUX89971.1 MAG: exodeoxyribonuclease VII small subunit [Hyphomonas sp. TMED31]KCZ59917.1 exodeoxyribonuclease VII small subunit [Hyphomonas atlantica]MAH91749.1 exodeoxyribonuclease VII small subunit [Hyphomonas sp.]MAM07483.1 exodeoxyribonuclease VII small subunit [Hyphomonas sp.]HBF90914.1 exodeoxyribonuclease VII small subunit [Hyphomonas atlantica]|tara:strand:- start:268 stop:513 length:246 start_codon:yes stop_codon:yes gene_type:complete
MADATQKPVDKLTFEEALAELEVIVRQLEAGEVELEKSIAIYERGAALKAHCESRLKSAELKVEQIVQGANGPTTEPASFD